MPNDKYGRVRLAYGVVVMAGRTLEPAYLPTDGLVLNATEDNLQIRAGATYSWAAVRFVLHQERPSISSTNDDWEESSEVVVTFSTSPYLEVNPPQALNVDLILQDLDIAAGTYGVLVRARGILESHRRKPEPITSLENAPPPEKLLQQVRLDLWPTDYPHDLNYDPFSEIAR